MVNYQEVEAAFTAANPQDLRNLAPTILAKVGDQKIWLIEGEMGAGKTTLIQAICQEMEVLEVVNSPTYGLVHEYRNHQEDTIYHFDFYRLKNEAEAQDIGCEEYFYSGNLCFIEWGSKVSSLIPNSHVKVHLLVQDDQSRKIVIQKHD